VGAVAWRQKGTCTRSNTIASRGRIDFCALHWPRMASQDQARRSQMLCAGRCVVGAAITVGSIDDRRARAKGTASPRDRYRPARARARLSENQGGGREELRIHSSQCASAIGGRALAHAAHPSSSPPDSEVWPSPDAARSPQARGARSGGRGGHLSAGMLGAFLRDKRNDSSGGRGRRQRQPIRAIAASRCSRPRTGCRTGPASAVPCSNAAGRCGTRTPHSRP